MISLHILQSVFLLIYFGCVNVSVKAHQIDLFSDIDLNGTKTTIDLENCTNLQPPTINTTSSVHTQYFNCVQLYNGLNCSGNCIKLSSRAPFHHHLGRWDFNDKTQSVGICKDPCTLEEGQAISSPPNNSFSSTILTLYSHKNFKGVSYEIEVLDGCTPATDLFIPITTFYSLRIPKGKCILAFTDQWDATENSSFKDSKNCIVRTDKVSFVKNVLEFNDDVPSMDNLKDWGLYPKETIKAFGPCKCKYSSVSPPPSPAVENGKLVTLFSDTKFRGDLIRIPLNFKDCLDLSSRGWEGVSKSIDVSKGSCVAAYKERDCKGLSHVELTTEIRNLSEYNLDMEIRSLKVCNQNQRDIVDSFLYIYVTIPVVSLSIIVSAILAFVMITKKWKNTKQGKLSEKEISEFIEGLGFNVDESREEIIEPVESNGDLNGIETNNQSEPSKLSSDFLAQNQPYNYKLEIALSHLHFDNKCPIGAGEYGIVYKGTMTQPGEADVIPVAIKTMKPCSNAQGLRTLLKEVKVLMFVGHHKQIVTLIGCSTLNLRQGELFVVMEYCEKGSLERYLKANRSNFVNIVQKGQIINVDRHQPVHNIEPIVLTSKTDPNYMQIYEENSSLGSNTFSIQQLICWSIEIAEGMEYLASKKVIHGDLSARNILLDSNVVAKISDFGLSRKMYCYSEYKRNGEEPLPWRWLALESLKNLEFSTKSDVWGFGILLWELFTLGEQPYPGISSLTNNFIVNLEQGLRPTFPPFATSDIYSIMSTCWDENAKRRPSFSQLNCSLQELKDF